MTEAQTQPQTVVAFDEVKNLVGKSLGHSAWREITQEQVNTFADLRPELVGAVEQLIDFVGE